MCLTALSMLSLQQWKNTCNLKYIIIEKIKSRFYNLLFFIYVLVYEKENNCAYITKNITKIQDVFVLTNGKTEINAKVIIKCADYAGKELVLPTRTITLDDKGCCEVTGIEAKRLLTIPGYELSK